MPRANRYFIAGYVWHITQRCHERRFLLRHARDRARWRFWLFQARRRYGLCVLNYTVTRNHVHLLVLDGGKGEISSSMQLLAARVGQEFNIRTRRQGAFWQDRYHATAVESGEHLLRCVTYIDLNMVRTGTVSHPREWMDGSYHELLRHRQRYRVTDVAALCTLLGHTDAGGLMAHRDAAIAEAVGGGQLHRDPVWTESIAVGGEGYVELVRGQLGLKAQHRQLRADGYGWSLAEPHASYSLAVT